MLKVFYSNNPCESFGFAVVLQNVRLLILSPSVKCVLVCVLNSGHVG